MFAGRRHCHAVWSGIDRAAMKAIPLSFSKRKLMDISRELYLVRKGLRGLFDRLGGQHRRIQKRNEQEAYEALKRDQQERDALIFRQLDQRRVSQARMERIRKLGDARSRSLSRDRDQYEEINTRKREATRFQARRQPHRPSRGPGREQ